MAFLTDNPAWETGVFQLETTTLALGGAGGVMNTPAQHLANRTAYLKAQVELRLPLAGGDITGDLGVGTTETDALLSMASNTATSAQIRLNSAAGGYSNVDFRKLGLTRQRLEYGTDDILRLKTANSSGTFLRDALTINATGTQVAAASDGGFFSTLFDINATGASLAASAAGLATGVGTITLAFDTQDTLAFARATNVLTTTIANNAVIATGVASTTLRGAAGFDLILNNAATTTDGVAALDFQVNTVQRASIVGQRAGSHASQGLMKLGVSNTSGTNIDVLTLRDASVTSAVDLIMPSANGGGQLAGFRNRVINGDMRLYQRGSYVNSGYSVDRWTLLASLANLSAGQGTGAQSAAGFAACLRIVTGTGTTASAAQVFGAGQVIEGFNVADLKWGTAAAQPVTSSFFVYSAVTGLHAVAFRNSAINRSYVATYTVNAANTWEYKTVTVPGDTTGTWLKDSGHGVSITFDVGSGSNFNTTAGAWQAGNFLRTSGTANVIATTSNEFRATGVQFELGSQATPFEQRGIGLELSLCQRYFCTLNLSVQGPAAGFMSVPFFYPSTMRVAPSVANISAGTAVNAAHSATATVSDSAGYWQVNVTAGGGSIGGRIEAFTSEF